MSEPTGRSCGGCTACCFTHAIQHFDKPAAQQCAHCNVGVGCKIYPQHPEECRGYKCFWLMKDFPEEMRPDKSGVVIDFAPLDKLKDFEFIRMWEVRPGVLDTPVVQALIDIILKSKCVLLLKYLQPDSTYAHLYLGSTALREAHPEFFKD